MTSGRGMSNSSIFTGWCDKCSFKVHLGGGGVSHKQSDSNDDIPLSISHLLLLWAVICFRELGSKCHIILKTSTPRPPRYVRCDVRWFWTGERVYIWFLGMSIRYGNLCGEGGIGILLCRFNLKPQLFTTNDGNPGHQAKIQPPEYKNAATVIQQDPRVCVSLLWALIGYKGVLIEEINGYLALWRQSCGSGFEMNVSLLDSG